jgi:hypothetical protein
MFALADISALTIPDTLPSSTKALSLAAVTVSEALNVCPLDKLAIMHLLFSVQLSMTIYT